MRTLDNDCTRTNKAVILNNYRGCLHRLKNAANTYSTRQMDVLAYLCARAYRSPGIDHRSRINISSDIDIRRHHNSSWGNIRTITSYCVRYHANTERLKIVFKFHFVIPLKLSRSHRTHLLNREIEDYRLLDPFIYLPLTLLNVDRLGCTQLTLVNSLNNTAYSLFRSSFREQLAILPRALDYLFLLFEFHNLKLLRGNCCTTSPKFSSKLRKILIQKRVSLFFSAFNDIFE